MHCDPVHLFKQDRFVLKRVLPICRKNKQAGRLGETQANRYVERVSVRYLRPSVQAGRGSPDPYLKGVYNDAVDLSEQDRDGLSASGGL